MAAKPKRGSPQPLDDEGEEYSRFQIPLDAAGVEQVQAQVGELPDTAKVNVYRMRPGVRPPFAFLEQMSGEHFDLPDIKARFGGGEFLIRAWQKGVTGFLVNERFAIEGEPIVARTTTPAVPIAIPSTVPGAPPIFMVPGQGGDAITALAGMFTQAIDRLGTMLVQQQKPQGMRETLELLTVAKALAVPPQQGGDVLGMLTQVMGIMREANPVVGENGRADGWSLMQTAIDKVLPEIVKRLPLNAPPQIIGPYDPTLLPQPQPRPQPQPGSLAEAAALASASLAPLPINSPQSGVAPVKLDAPVTATLSVYVPMLAQAAAIGADPGDYAVNIVDMIDALEGAEPTVRTFFAEPGWFAQLAASAPLAAPHGDWFARLRDEILAILDAPEPSPEAAEHFGE
ncbi:MAG: hypothetical protein ACREPG_00200 [Candidatus Binatia bacterium]